MAKTSPFRFMQEVRQEVTKVTWPSGKETAQTTLMVFVMVTFVSLFFLLVDWILSNLVQLILGVGG